MRTIEISDNNRIEIGTPMFLYKKNYYKNWNKYIFRAPQTKMK